MQIVYNRNYRTARSRRLKNARRRIEEKNFIDLLGDLVFGGRSVRQEARESRFGIRYRAQYLRLRLRERRKGGSERRKRRLHVLQTRIDDRFARVLFQRSAKFGDQPALAHTGFRC